MNRESHTVTIPVEDYERMRLGLARYEFVRCLNVTQFKEMLVERAMQDGIPFDELVDVEMAAARQKEKQRREDERKAMLKGPFKPVGHNW